MRSLILQLIYGAKWYIDLEREIEYYTEWEEKKRNDPKYVPSDDDVEYYVLDKNMKLKEIQA